MSQMFVLPSLELLLIAGRAIALVLGLLIFAWAFRHWRRAATRDTQRVFEQLDLVRSELLIMKEVMHHSADRAADRAADRNGDRTGGRMSDRTDRTAQRAPQGNDAAVRNQQEARLPMPANNGAARGYEIAARMARNGAGKEELMRGCGITGHEAELLVKLHGQRIGQQGTHSKSNAAELVGRQTRTAASAVPANGTDSRQSLSNAQVLQGQARQTASPPRQMPAATATQRTPVPAAVQARTPSLARSRLVAVG